MASPHLRRRVALRVIITALTLTIPAAWAIGRVRAAARWVRLDLCGPAQPVPGLPADGEPLTAGEARALIGITRSWKHTAAERSQA